MYQAVLADAKFHEQLLAFDRDLGGALHSGSYARKPRGGPAGLGQEYAERFSFCCAVDGCRTRATPPSLRFLGRHVYLATVVTLISASALGITPSRLARLSVVPGLDRRTLARWRAWSLPPSPTAPSRRSRWRPWCRRSTSRHCRSRCSSGSPATWARSHRLAALPWAADRRCIGDTRFLTGASDPQRMRVAAPRRGRLPSVRAFSEGGRGGTGRIAGA